MPSAQLHALVASALLWKRHTPSAPSIACATLSSGLTHGHPQSMKSANLSAGLRFSISLVTGHNVGGELHMKPSNKFSQRFGAIICRNTNPPRCGKAKGERQRETASGSTTTRQTGKQNLRLGGYAFLLWCAFPFFQNRAMILHARRGFRPPAGSSNDEQIRPHEPKIRHPRHH